MPSYHLSVKSVSRSAGRSATAAAAYRSGSSVVDLRTGEIHDYTRKQGVLHSEIVLPDGAPDWARERASLWNAAEAAEKRKDGRVAKEFEIALPHELAAEARQKLAVDFARELSERYKVAADVCIHAPARGEDDKNYHAHILLTTRQITSDGLAGKCDIELDGSTLKKLNLPNSKDQIADWRKRWEVMQNAALEKAGIAERVDCRTLEAQGIDRVPQVHLGVAAVEMDERGIESDRMQRWNDIEDTNHSIRRLQHELDRQIALGERREQGVRRGADIDPADSRHTGRISQPVADGSQPAIRATPDQSAAFGTNAPTRAAERRTDKSHARPVQNDKKPAKGSGSPSTGRERGDMESPRGGGTGRDADLDRGHGVGTRRAGAADERSRDSVHQPSGGRDREGATGTAATATPAPMSAEEAEEKWRNEALKAIAKHIGKSVEEAREGVSQAAKKHGQTYDQVLFSLQEHVQDKQRQEQKRQQEIIEKTAQRHRRNEHERGGRGM